MLVRRHAWPAGHWDWPIAVTHKHGIRCGDLLFFGGQVDLDTRGKIRNPGNLTAQTRAAMRYIEAVLRELDAEFADLVKLVCFYVHHEDADAERVLAEMAAALGPPPGPVVTLIPVPALAYEGLQVEIEGVAMRGVDGKPMRKIVASAPAADWLPAPFSQALRCGRMLFTGGQTALGADSRIEAAGDAVVQTRVVMDRIGSLLRGLGADHDDAVKLNRYYVAGGTAAEWQAPALACAAYFKEPGPAATGIPLPTLFRPGLMVSLEVIAMRAQDGSRLPRAHVWPAGHWDWPVHLPYKHGIRCGNLICIGGQVSMDEKGVILEPGELVPQTRTSMRNIARVLAGFGATLNDVVKVTAFYAAGASAEALHANLSIRSASFDAPGPASTGIPLPCLAYQQMDIEIEILAMID